MIVRVFNYLRFHYLIKYSFKSSVCKFFPLKYEKCALKHFKIWLIDWWPKIKENPIFDLKTLLMMVTQVEVCVSVKWLYKMYLCCSSLSQIPFVFVCTHSILCPSRLKSIAHFLVYMFMLPVALVCARKKKLNTYLEPLSPVDVSFSPLLYFFRTHIIFFLPFCAQLPWNVVKVVSLIRTPAKKLIKTTKF